MSGSRLPGPREPRRKGSSQTLSQAIQQARAQVQVQAGSLYNPFHEPVSQVLGRQTVNAQQQPIGVF
jgi:hypothetical protein